MLDTILSKEGITKVALTSGELTSLCPISGRPDFNTLVIEYAPNGLLLESKSVKLYIGSFREVGIFCEHLAARICSDIVGALAPKWCRVVVTQHVRGGIVIDATSEWGAEA